MASIMLVAFASWALIPPGFMPASGHPFSIEICWEGLPADLLAQVESSHADFMDMDPTDRESMGPHPVPANSMPAGSGPHRGPHHHHDGPSPGEHCIFGTACGSGPIPHVSPARDFSSPRLLRAAAFASIAVAVRIVHVPQPRAPPGRLS
jgi:hypothetical protein